MTCTLWTFDVRTHTRACVRRTIFSCESLSCFGRSSTITVIFSGARFRSHEIYPRLRSKAMLFYVSCYCVICRLIPRQSSSFNDDVEDIIEPAQSALLMDREEETCSLTESFLRVIWNVFVLGWNTSLIIISNYLIFYYIRKIIDATLKIIVQ